MTNRTLVRGDTKTWVLTFTTAGGSAYDLTGCSVWFTAKRFSGQTDADAPVRHYWTESAESGISLTNRDTGLASAIAAGLLYHALSAAESAALAPRDYPYDYQFRDADGNVTTLELGTLTVGADVTQRTTIP